MNPPGRKFHRSHRLSGRSAFARVFQDNVRAAAGPLVALAVPNGLPHWRLGLSVSRQVGNAVQRNAIKRRLREAFRLAGRELPGGYDLVIVVRPHHALATAEYRKLLPGLLARLHAGWSARPMSGSGRTPTENLT